MITAAYIRLALAILLLGLITALPVAAAESVEALAAGNNVFALDLYSRLRSNEGNLFLSPFSISTCLAMVYTGARGDTATQMAQVLHFNSTPNEIAGSFGAFQRQLKPASNSFELNLANGLWVQAGHHFLQPFLDLASQQFDAKLNQVDFRAESESARAQINDWVSQQTKGKITDLIQRGVLHAGTRLVLVNAIYFKGRWAEPFETKMTTTAPFSVTPENKVTVPLMHSEPRCNYAETDGLQLLELPYANVEPSVTPLKTEPLRQRPTPAQPASDGGLSMVVLLPHDVGGLKKLEDSLNKSALDGWLAQARQQKIRVYLPKFRMTSQFSLAQTLAAMGMTKPFSAAADFSGMDGARDLFLSAVVHKAYVDVNEEGTEAAAATAGVMALTSVMPRPLPIFRADHPFIFLIRDTRSGTILFMGRISDPSR